LQQLRSNLAATSPKKKSNRHRRRNTRVGRLRWLPPVARRASFTDFLVFAIAANIIGVKVSRTIPALAVQRGATAGAALRARPDE
jgi:hypothetical protein